MKKNKALRIAVALLVVAILTTCGVTGSLAKYVDTFNVASGTVRAGLFKVEGPGTTFKTFDATIYDGDLSAETEAQAYTLGVNDNIIVPGTAVKAAGFAIVNYSEVDVEISLGAISLALTGFTDVPFHFTTKAPTLTTPASDWKTAAPVVADLMPAGATAGPNGGILLKSYPAGNASGANKVTLKDFYVLWPFDTTATAKDKIVSTSPDGAVTPPAGDTGIGAAQAGVLLDTAASNYAYLGDALTDNNFSITVAVTATQVD